MTLPLRLKAENLSCERGGRLVFSNLSFTIQAGEMLELRGGNGSGKSSLLRLLAGLNTHTAGTLVLENGTADLSLAEQAHYIGHADANKPVLTVSENLKFWSDFMGGNSPPLTTFNLAALAQDQALLLSAGQKRRLSLSRLKSATRPIWLLDEPDVGLDSASRAILQSEIEKHLAAGGMVLAATHTDLGLKSARPLLLGEVH